MNQLKSPTISTFVTCLSVLIQPLFAQPTKDRCDVPDSLRAAISRTYPGTTIAKLSDLNLDNREFFQKDHGDRCPGLVNADFYGDGKPTSALVLLKRRNNKPEIEFVIAHQIDQRWKVISLEKSEGEIPVAWSEDPGEYNDVYGNKKIRAPHQVVVLCWYESSAILYAWTGQRVEKIWISD